MSYHEIEGDLFTVGLPAIGHGCNCRGSMAGGIAVEFKRRYPEMHDEYRARCTDGRFRLGSVFVWEAADVVVYNLATQVQSGADARLDAVGTSVRVALVDAEERGLSALGLPRIGTGIGGLRWVDVDQVLRAVGEASPVRLTVVVRPSGW